MQLLLPYRVTNISGLIKSICYLKIEVTLAEFVCFRNPVVPVCSFGETDIYDQLTWPDGSYMKRLQDFIRKKIGMAPVVPVGRGFFQYTFGLIPRRRPITVVGKYSNL